MAALFRRVDFQSPTRFILDLDVVVIFGPKSSPVSNNTCSSSFMFAGHGTQHPATLQT
jgi:hypothetical protein